MEVQTVTGKISASDMGVTPPHEHIFVDSRESFPWSKPSQKDELHVVDARVSLEIMGFLLHNMFVCKDNFVLDDPETMANELLMFKARGGKTVVDVTPRGTYSGPTLLRPTALRDLSQKVGLNIVAGTSYSLFEKEPGQIL